MVYKEPTAVDIRVFGTWDIVIFVLLFVGSAGIGFYNAYMDRNKRNVENFHRGNRRMHPLPVSLSLSATCLSALTILGNPAEVYTYGTMYLWLIFAQFVGTAIAAHIFLPVFYHINNISCFSYIHRRFGKFVRMLTSVLFLIQTLMYLGLVVYVPSLAIEAVTNISLWACMVAMATVCTLYTTLGGMKTVIWTDTLQFLTMVIGLVALLVVGAIKTGGFANAWDIANKNGRIQFTDFSVDPRTRHSVWSVGIGGAISWSFIFGIRQANVQRACSVSTLQRAQLALWLNYPLTVLIVLLTGMIGIVMYAFYHGCDPVQYGTINKNDQLVTRMVIDVLGSIPGLTGVFMACIVSGSLSSMSSALNALSATILEDITLGLGIKRFVGWEFFLSKLSVVLLGVASFGTAVFVSQASGLVIQLSYTLFSIVSGPVLGCFVAGMLIPWINHKGASVGVLVSLCVMCWLIVGSRVNTILGAPPLPVLIDDCHAVNSSEIEMLPNMTITAALVTSSPALTDGLTTSNISRSHSEESIVFQFYRISYTWNTGLGMLVNLSTAFIVSFLTGFTDPTSIDRSLLHPVLTRLYNLPVIHSEQFEGTINQDIDNTHDVDGTFTDVKENKKHITEQHSEDEIQAMVTDNNPERFIMEQNFS